MNSYDLSDMLMSLIPTPSTDPMLITTDDMIQFNTFLLSDWVKEDEANPAHCYE